MKKPEELENLKSKYGLTTLHVIEFNSNSADGYDPDYPSLSFVFKKVGFDVLAASAAISQENPVKAIKMQMEACLLEGDKEQLFNPNDATVFTSVMQEFVKITQARTTALKKI